MKERMKWMKEINEGKKLMKKWIKNKRKKEMKERN